MGGRNKGEQLRLGPSGIVFCRSGFKKGKTFK